VHCFFVSDLHGRVDRYRKLFAAIADERPGAVFLGGDLLPFPGRGQWPGDAGSFVEEVMLAGCIGVREALAPRAPEICLVLGNDDERVHEKALERGQTAEAWIYLHGRRVRVGRHAVYGYSCVPPTPFLLKDWERYDVSRYVDPGCVSPEEGERSVPADPDEIRYGTIAGDLEQLVGDEDVTGAIFLCHAPPYGTALDRAGLDGQAVDHAPVDVHVGSIAIQRLIEARQPLLTLHGHVHESTRLTGTWRIQIGRTHCFTAAHDGPELALVRFDTDELESATRDLL
jgi:Icc-related predicted phosphoesterase